MADSFHNSHIASLGRGNEKLCFCSNLIRSLVAMAIYGFHRHLMGKVESHNIFCLNEDSWNLFLQKCLLCSPLHFIRLLSKSLNLIGFQGHKNVCFSQKC